jgi:plastocyanin
MLRAGFRTLFLLGFSLAASHGADVHGTIVIERKLTKRNVTPAAGLYQRGTPVELGADAPLDPLVFERSHVVIYVEGQGPASPVTATIEQENRRFVPDLVTIPAGSTVSFPNFDPVFHNVFSLSKPKTFDLGNYPKGQTRNVTFPKTGVVLVYCHLHPNMASTIVVTPNSWSTMADGSGRFTLPGLPAGKYTIAAFHKAAGTFRKTVTVEEQGIPDLRFIIPLAAEPDPQSLAHHR